MRAGSWLFATLAIWAALLRLPLYGACSLLLAAGLGRPISDAVASRGWHPRTVRYTLAGLLGLLGVLAALSSGRQAIREHLAVAGLPPPPPGARNVVLIVWDTVRAYNLSPYGYPRNTTPNLARWAREGVRYNLAVAPAPWTYPSHSCFFTGQWPFKLNSQWKFHARYSGSDPGGVPGLAGLSDRRVRGEHQLLQLRDRAGSRLRPFRGFPADSAVPPRSHGTREVDPQEHPVSRPLSRHEVDRPPIPRCARDQRSLPRLAAPAAAGSSLLRLPELFRRPRAVRTPAGI